MKNNSQFKVIIHSWKHGYKNEIPFLLLDPTHLTFNPAQIKKGFTQITYQ